MRKTKSFDGFRAAPARMPGDKDEARSLRFLTGLCLAAIAAWQPVAAENRSHWVQGVGYVEPATEIRRLAFRYPGVIGRCAGQVGQAVRRGEVLMEQDNAEEKAAVALAESTLAVARSELARLLAGVNPEEIRAKEQARNAAAAEVEYAERHLARIGKLASTRFVSAAEHELAATDLKRKLALQRQLEAEAGYLRHYVRDVDRVLAEARVEQAERELDAARQKLEQTLLRAPIDGTVLEILHREGEATHLMGNADPVLLLGETRHLRVRAEFDESYALKIEAGQKASISGRALGGTETPGSVVLVKPIMGKKTVFTKAASEWKDVDVIQVLVEPAPGFAAPVGMEVEVRVEAGDGGSTALK
jgi:HlyD family secretion protein